MWKQSKSKFGNKKVTIGNETFDSKGEWQRWLFLQDAERRGEIKDLKRQVKFVLVPTTSYTETVQLKTKTKVVKRVFTREVTYTADFVYMKLDKETESDYLGGIQFWKKVVEDFKGMPNDRWPIKKALMADKYGIFIREVKKPTEPI